MAEPQVAPEEGSPGEEQGEDGAAIFKEAAQALSQAMQWLSGQPLPEEIKQAASEILQKFGDLADAVMSASGGEGGPVPADQGAVPMQAGATGVPMGPQTPN